MDELSNTNNLSAQDYPQDSEEGAVIFSASVDGAEFQLIYQAKEEPLGGSKARIAKSIVDFAKSHQCGYVLLTDGNCWISPDNGISLLAQIEGNEELEQFDLVVMPFDHTVYIARINEGLVTAEHVTPLDQAIDSLLEHPDLNIAVHAGGTLTEKLEKEGFAVNCQASLVVTGKEASPFKYLPLDWLLIKNKLYHQKLLIPLGIILLIVSFIVYFFAPQTRQQAELSIINATQDMGDKIAAELPILPILPTGPDYLNNSASKMFSYISPWITGTTIDFLRTCRLTNVKINKDTISFSGQRMSKTSMQHFGCGYDRLRQVSRDHRLNLSIKDYDWTVDTALVPLNTQKTNRTEFIATMDRLELLAQYLNWELSIQNAKPSGDNQEVTIVLRGQQLTADTLSALQIVFSEISAQLKQGALKFNPDSLELLDASFEVIVHTASRT